MIISRLIPVAAALLLSQPASARAPFLDPATGFGIAPPAPFVAEPTSRRQFDVGVGIKSTTGSPRRPASRPTSARPASRPLRRTTP